MKRMTALLCAAALIGCAGGDDTDVQQAEDSAAAAMAPAPTPLSLSDVAGTWSVRAMSETGDSVLTTYTLTATGEPTGWTMTFPNRDPIPLRVTVDADSLIFDTDPYESTLRPGVQVRTEGSSRFTDGRMVGTFTAHYVVTTPDSVMRGRLEGTRNP